MADFCWVLVAFSQLLFVGAQSVTKVIRSAQLSCEKLLCQRRTAVLHRVCQVSGWNLQQKSWQRTEELRSYGDRELQFLTKIAVLPCGKTDLGQGIVRLKTPWIDCQLLLKQLLGRIQFSSLQMHPSQFIAQKGSSGMSLDDLRDFSIHKGTPLVTALQSLNQQQAIIDTTRRS